MKGKVRSNGTTQRAQSTLGSVLPFALLASEAPKTQLLYTNFNTNPFGTSSGQRAINRLACFHHKIDLLCNNLIMKG